MHSLFDNAPPFLKAMLAAKIAHRDGDIATCTAFLLTASIEAKTDAERNKIADFVKEKGLRL